MPNAQRGEIEIQLNGKLYILRPSFSAMCEAEDRSNEGLSSLLFKFAKGRAGIRDVTALIYGGLIGSGCREFTFEQVGELIRKNGFSNYVGVAANFLKAGVEGDQSDNEEAQTGNRLEASQVGATPQVQTPTAV